MKDYTKEINDVEAVLRRLKGLQERIDKGEYDVCDLAIDIHRNLCVSNHTDACAWQYEGGDTDPDWSQDTHLRYLTKAKAMVETLPQVKIKDIASVIGKLR